MKSRSPAAFMRWLLFVLASTAGGPAISPHAWSVPQLRMRVFAQSQGAPHDQHRVQVARGLERDAARLPVPSGGGGRSLHDALTTLP